jgi:hypothetical protein
VLTTSGTYLWSFATQVFRNVRSYGNTMGATSGTETANSSRAPEYTPGCLLPVVTLTCSRVVAHSCPEGISTGPDKVKTVQDWPRPKTPKQMRGLSWSLLLGATSGTETANSSRAPEYTPGCLLPLVTLTCSRVVAHSGSKRCIDISR